MRLPQFNSDMQTTTTHAQANTIARAATSLVLAAICTATGAQQLWPKTEHGMSPAAVSRQVPQAKPFVQTWTNSNRSTCARRAERMMIGGAPFHVCFMFIDDKLFEVGGQQVDEYVANDSTRETYERISAEFTKRYGPPTSGSIESRHAGLFGGANWQQGETRISLKISPSTQHTSHLWITFKK